MRRRIRTGPAIICLIARAPLAASAAPGFDAEQRALPCRARIACTADILPPGSAEVESGYLYRRLHPPARQHSVPFLAKLTLTDWVQLQLGGNGATLENAPGATPTTSSAASSSTFATRNRTLRRWRSPRRSACHSQPQTDTYGRTTCWRQPTPPKTSAGCTRTSSGPGRLAPEYTS